jgi:capsid portal protein
VIDPAGLAEVPLNERANEIVHFKLYSSRSPYGIPRYIGVLMDMFGDRKASEINYTTFCNNTIPSLIVSVSNGELTADTVERIQEFLEKIQGDDNRSKVLILEAEPAGTDGEQAGQIKIDVKPLTNEQIKDALFQEYTKSNQEKVRVAYRLPPIIVGRSSDYTRATADTSRRLADEQVFAPDRDTFDDWVNRILFPTMNILYHAFKSNSPNTTDNIQLVQILSSAEKTGGMTPRRADMVLKDILGRDLPDFAKEEKFNLDLPFSLSMAEAVKNMGEPTEPGQQVTALKKLGLVDSLTGGDENAEFVVKALLTLRDKIEEEWLKMVA